MTSSLSNTLSAISPVLVDMCNRTSIAPAVFDQFEASTRHFITSTLGGATALRSFDHWVRAESHPLTNTFPMMNPFDVLLVCIAYLVAVFVGRIIMSPLPPLSGLPLKLIQIVHNLFLVVLSAYMVAETVNQAFIRNNYTLFGNAQDNTSRGAGMARIVWIFYASKVLEFIDTFIMVLKKSDRQITFLHLYHHTTIYTIWWAVAAFGPGGDAYYCVVLNSFVHVIMYAYYLSTSCNVPLSFIKPYITQMQMGQFLLMMGNATYNLIFPAKYPYYLFALLEVYMVTLLALFLNFYLSTYASKPRRGDRPKVE